MEGVADFSTSERLTLAKKGDAEPGGRFPIRDTGDLQNAIRAYGRSKTPGQTRAFIIQRAKQLGATHMLPPSWM